MFQLYTRSRHPWQEVQTGGHQIELYLFIMKHWLAEYLEIINSKITPWAFEAPQTILTHICFFHESIEIISRERLKWKWFEQNLTINLYLVNLYKPLSFKNCIKKNLHEQTRKTNWDIINDVKIVVLQIDITH